MEPFLGQVQLFAFNFAPRGWAKCEGQLLQIAQYTALFSLLGTTYGGDGRTTFALPDLRGAVPIGQGQGPGLTNRAIGQRGGNESTTLSEANLASHSHNANLVGSTAMNNDDEASGNTLGKGEEIYTDGPNDSAMAGGSVNVESTGSGTSFSNMPPFEVSNYCIALTGVFPSRN